MSADAATATATAAAALADLRARITQSLGAGASKVVGGPLAQLDQLIAADEPVDPEVAAPLLDLLEDLLEALMHEARWQEPTGGAG